MPNISSGSISLADINTQFGIPAATQIDMSSGITALGGASIQGAITQMSDFYYRQAGLQQDGKAVGTKYVGTSRQGSSVALSSDGNTLAVGGRGDNSSIGAVWIFTKLGNGWVQQGDKLIGAGAINAIGQASGQGRSVALSADGNTLAIGFSLDNAGIGAVWIFTRTDGVWTQQGSKLVGTGYVNSSGVYQGVSVALSADGNTLAVGGSGDNSGKGAVWIFMRIAGVWTQQSEKLTGSGSAGMAGQGYSVALSSDGNTLAASGYYDDNVNGAVWVFIRSESVWAQQGSKLVGTGAGGTGGSQQGTRVALSSDGNTLAVGAPIDLGVSGTYYIGAVWIFARTAGVWAQQGNKLVGTGNVNESQQGTSVALSADGNTLAVGGQFDNSSIGAVWIFSRSVSTWTQQGNKLVTTLAVATYPTQGSAVALSADGNILISCSTIDNSSVGAAFTFIRSGTTWSGPANTSKITSADASGTQGQSVSLSADGNTLAVGSPTDSSSIGSTLIFTRSGSSWTQQGSKLVGTGYVGSPQQGFCISLSADGNTLAVGAFNDNSGNGACWVFTRTAGVWTQQGDKLVGLGVTAGGYFGRSVALSADGNTLAVGATVDAGSVGSVCVFTRTAGVWSQQGSKLVGTGYVNSGGVYQGRSVALSADGNTLAVGANNDNTGQGAVWIFTRSAGVWTQQGSKLAGTASSYFGYFVSLNADGNTLAVGAPGASGASGGSYVFIRTDGVWAQQGSKLVGTGGVTTSNYQGWSVALTADGNALAVGAYGDNSGQGAVWIFTRTAGVWSQQGSKLAASGGVGRQLGSSVSFSGNGNTLAAGAPVNNATWIFT